MRLPALSFRAWLLLVVAGSLAVGGALATFTVDRIWAAQSRAHFTELFNERLDGCAAILEKHQESLESLGLADAFKGSIQAAARQEIAARYYKGRSDDAYPVILDAQGRLLLHPALAAGAGSAPAAGPLNRFLTQGSGAFPDPGGERWGISRPFAPWGWTVVYSIPARAMTVLMLKVRLYRLAALIALLGLVSAAVSLLVSMALRPISRLTEAALRMAAGDLDAEIDSDRQDELGSLARSFKGLRDAIQAQFEERAAALEESRARFQALLDNCAVGIFLASGERVILQASRFGCAMFGYEPAELPGQSFRLIHVSEEAFTAFGVYARNPGAFDVRGIEYRMRRRDGSIFWANLTGTHLDPRNPAYGTIWTIRDITDGKRAVELLEARNVQLEEARAEALAGAQVKSNFLANMSHEIRTPMNGVLGTAELLAATNMDPEQREYIRTITSCGEALLVILNDILDLAKLDAGKLQLESIPFDPLVLAQDVISLFRPKAAEVPLELRVDSDPAAPPRLLGDPGRLRQVLGNLLSNAIKFTAKGHVRIALRTVADPRGGFRLEIAVEDTGMGIPKAVQATLFQPFTQADASTSRNFGGTGLGLALCRKILDAMDASLALESEEGAGSCFLVSVRLPAAPAEAGEPAAPPVDLAPAPAGLRILLAEDNRVNQVIARTILEKLGARVQLCGDGFQAVAAVAQGTFDLILMDCQMPGLDGYQATGRIRALEAPQGARTPIIALTAHAMLGDREKCLAAGMDDYLTKPITRDNLEQMLRRWGGAGTAEPA